MKIGYIDENPGSIEEQFKKVAKANSFGDSHRECPMNEFDVTKQVEVDSERTVVIRRK